MTRPAGLARSLLLGAEAGRLLGVQPVWRPRFLRTERAPALGADVLMRALSAGSDREVRPRPRRRRP